MTGHPTTDEQNDCLMCIPDYRKDHIANDKVQDARINTLEKRFMWIVVASFIGSTAGTFASNILTRTSLVVGWVSELLGG